MTGSTRHDYRLQAETYDRTRGASPSVLAPLRDALAGVAGRRLLDAGGGTGNYAAALATDGWDVVVADISEAMLARAAAKRMPVVLCDAARLPVAGASQDVVTMISMMHLLPDWRRALTEAQRVLRPGGRLAVMAYTRENLEVHWIWGYFPGARARLDAEHQGEDEIASALPGCRVAHFTFQDLTDASTAALCRQPKLLLDPAMRAQTSFFERLERDDPEALAAGIRALEKDLAAGRRPEREVEDVRRRYGDGTMISWSKP